VKTVNHSLVANCFLIFTASETNRCSKHEK